MSATPAGTSSGDGTYIRGGGTRSGAGAEITPRRLATILIWLLVALLVTFSVYFASSASNQNSRLSALRQRGVPVTATVTGCVGISSGVGMGIEFWQCRGTYSLAGETFNEVINGSRRLFDSGRQVQAIAVPGQPALLSTVSAVRNGRSSSGQYAAAAGLGAGAVALAGGWFVFQRARRRRHQ